MRWIGKQIPIFIAFIRTFAACGITRSIKKLHIEKWVNSRQFIYIQNTSMEIQVTQKSKLICRFIWFVYLLILLLNLFNVILEVLLNDTLTYTISCRAGNMESIHYIPIHTQYNSIKKMSWHFSYIHIIWYISNKNRRRQRYIYIVIVSFAVKPTHKRKYLMNLQKKK